MNVVEQYMRLFRGRTDAYGTGQGKWIHREPTSDCYAQHLKGQGSGLGIAPLLDDGTVWFAAIDLDEPDFEAAIEMQGFLSFGQTWVERSRSGNAHVWAFFEKPIEAWIVRGVMREATAAIGKPAVEIFPKADKLLEGMVGNYINLPYHSEARPMLWGTDAEDAITLKDFLTKASATLNDPSLWRKRADWLMIAPPDQRNRDQQEFGTGKELHMCAEWIIGNRDENPIGEGHRNVVYFNLAKMLSHYEGFSEEEAWMMLTLVRDSSDAKGVDHVPDHELRRILRNAQRGGFTSTGCDDPLMSPYVHPDCPIAKGC
jgi:hypothetical protein